MDYFVIVRQKGQQLLTANQNYDYSYYSVVLFFIVNILAMEKVRNKIVGRIVLVSMNHE